MPCTLKGQYINFDLEGNMKRLMILILLIAGCKNPAEPETCNNLLALGNATCDFNERNTIAGWAADISSGVYLESSNEIEAIDGKYVLKINGGGIGNYAWQSFTTEPGTEYTATGYLNGENAYISIGTYVGLNNLGQSVLGDSAEWSILTVAFTAQGMNTYINLRNADGPTVLYADKVVVKE